MKILITGSNGVLGTKITKRLLKTHEIIGADLHPESMIDSPSYYTIDITDFEIVHALFESIRPDICIHTAAYTAVDRAEAERDIAERVNVFGTKNIAKASQSFDTKLVYISTDYIFDGEDGPYSEDAKPHPLSWYGETKYRGELEVTNLENSIIARTTVLYGHESHLRPTFVSWLVTELKAGRPVRIVNDQYSNPTLAEDMAEMLTLLVENDLKGVFNTMGGEYLNRYEFSLLVASYFGLDSHLITPISTASLSQPAKRPLRGGGDISKIRSLGYDPLSVHSQLDVISRQITL